MGGADRRVRSTHLWCLAPAAWRARILTTTETEVVHGYDTD